MELELTHCPQCGHPAEVVERALLQSTNGPIEHVKVHCISGHWFKLPAGDIRGGASLSAAARSTAPPETQGGRRSRVRYPSARSFE